MLLVTMHFSFISSLLGIGGLTDETCSAEDSTRIIVDRRIGRITAWWRSCDLPRHLEYHSFQFKFKSALPCDCPYAHPQTSCTGPLIPKGHRSSPRQRHKSIFAGSTGCSSSSRLTGHPIWPASRLNPNGRSSQHVSTGAYRSVI